MQALSNEHNSQIMKHLLHILLCQITLMICTTLASCYGDAQKSDVMSVDTLAVEDTALSAEQRKYEEFYSKRHYTEGYNFIVRADSVALLMQEPEEQVSQLETDTFTVLKDHQVVVGEFRVLPQDSIDSVWVQLATDEGYIGWIHEQEMLKKVVPVDPISQFIMFFSDTHIIIAVVIIAIILCYLAIRIAYKRDVPIVHFRDIPTFYPTLLCLIVATAAAGYASLQMFAPDTWQHYFYNPTLNPLQMPFILGVFISSVWAMLVVLIATIDETFHKLTGTDAVFYLIGLCGVCATLYILFSITTLYYVGYPLLVAYYYYAISCYFKQRNLYICGKCGQSFRNKGRCPHCGVINE